MKKLVLPSILVLILFIFLIYFFGHQKIQQRVIYPEKSLFYNCDNDLVIEVGLSADVALVTLSDERQFTLEQVASASGARYTNLNNNIVLLMSDDVVTVVENGQTILSNCVAELDLNQLPKVPKGVIETVGIIRFNLFDLESNVPYLVYQDQVSGTDVFKKLIYNASSTCGNKDKITQCLALSNATPFVNQEVVVNGLPIDKDTILVLKLLTVSE